MLLRKKNCRARRVYRRRRHHWARRSGVSAHTAEQVRPATFCAASPRLRLSPHLATDDATLGRPLHRQDRSGHGALQQLARRRPRHVGRRPRRQHCLQPRAREGGHDLGGGGRGDPRRARAGARRVGGRDVRRQGRRRGHPHGQRAAADRADRRAGRQGAHRAQPERPGGDRPAPPPARRVRVARRAIEDARAHGGGARARRGRHPDAGVHPPAVGAADPLGPLDALARVGVEARRRPPRPDRRADERVPARLGRALGQPVRRRPRGARRRPRLCAADGQLARRGGRPRLRDRADRLGRAADGAPLALRRGPHRLRHAGVWLRQARRRVRRAQFFSARNSSARNYASRAIRRRACPPPRAGTRRARR